jgi:streptogramin lyase
MTRTTSRLLGFALAAILLVTLASGTSDAAAHVRRLKNVWGESLSERVHSDSVAIGSDGTAWFGLQTPRGAGLAQVTSHRLSTQTPQGGKLPTEGTETYGGAGSLRFDSAGNLWFALGSEHRDAIARRAPDGTLTEFPLPEGGGVTALAIGSDGDVWFTRTGDSSATESVVGLLTPAGAISQFGLDSTKYPGSIVAGPDGAYWLTLPEADQIDRVTPSGEVQAFPLGGGIEPRQILVGPDGALWFSESGRHRPGKPDADRIGRITTNGEVTQFPITFGGGTQALALAPSGRIWFTTEGGEFASIGAKGNVGPRRCYGFCGGGYTSIAFAPSGALWFTSAGVNCSGCGGSASLEAENEGTFIGESPARSLKPATSAP